MLVIWIYYIRYKLSNSQETKEKEYFEIFKNIATGKINFEREKEI